MRSHKGEVCIGMIARRGDCCVGGDGEGREMYWIMRIGSWVSCHGKECAALPWIAGVSSGVEVVGVGSGDWLSITWR